VKTTARPAANGQIYREWEPRREVGRVLTCGWIQHVSPAGPAYEHRTVPNGSVEISCALSTGVVRVAGPTRKPTVAHLARGETIVGLRLRPGVAASLLGPPASELVGLEIDADRLWGRSARTLGQRLGAAASPEDAACLLEQEAITRWTDASEPDSLVVAAVELLQPWQATQVITVTAELFISQRQMRRRFLAAIGYGPKELQRILRFNGFLALSDTGRGSLGNAGDMTLADLARLAGYADQAHMSRECSRLSGFTPSALLQQIRSSCGPTHDHTASSAGLRRRLLSRQCP
jgi:AraC-like DNA-binding protein